MKKKFAAFLREENSLRELAMAGADKPTVDQIFMQRWQSMFGLVTMEANEHMVLILQVTQDQLSVLLKSNNSDQTTIDYYLKNGFYCASVLGKNGLLVETKAQGEPQDDTFDIPSVMACFGLPILWPDETLFGVVCVLNSPGKSLKPSYSNILSGLKTMMEQELVLLEKLHQQALQAQQTQQAPKAEVLPPVDNSALEQELMMLREQQKKTQASETDALTSIHSRKKLEDILKHEFERAKRYFKTFSVTMIDLNGFQEINNSFGSDAGDSILKAFAESVGQKIRETDSWGRWNGDTFVLVCPYADTVETQQMFSRIKPLVNRDMKALEAFSDFSYGVSQYEPDDLTYQAIVNRAEENMDQYKEMMKRKSLEASDDTPATGTFARRQL